MLNLGILDNRSTRNPFIAPEPRLLTLNEICKTEILSASIKILVMSLRTHKIGSGS